MVMIQVDAERWEAVKRELGKWTTMSRDVLSIRYDSAWRGQSPSHKIYDHTFEENKPPEKQFGENRLFPRLVASNDMDYCDGVVWTDITTWIWSLGYTISRPTGGWNFTEYGFSGAERFPRVIFKKFSTSFAKIAYVLPEILDEQRGLQPTDSKEFSRWVQSIVGLWTPHGEALIYTATQKIPQPQVNKEIWHTMPNATWCFKEAIKFSSSRGSEAYWKSHKATPAQLRTMKDIVGSEQGGMNPDEASYMQGLEKLLNKGLNVGGDALQPIAQSPIEFLQILQKWEVVNPEMIEYISQDKGRAAQLQRVRDGIQFGGNIRAKDFEQLLADEHVAFNNRQRDEGKDEVQVIGTSVEELMREQEPKDDLFSGGMTDEKIEQLKKMFERPADWTPETISTALSGRPQEQTQTPHEPPENTSPPEIPFDPTNIPLPPTPPKKAGQ